MMRFDLCRSVSPTSARDGCAGSPDGPAVPLAKSVCGATDRIDPAGVFGPHRRVQRIVSATRAQIVFCLLPRDAHALVVGERCTRVPTGSTAGAGVGRGTAGGR